MNVKIPFVVAAILMAIVGMILSFYAGATLSRILEEKKWSDFLDRAYERGEYRPGEGRCGVRGHSKPNPESRIKTSH
jgi:hypothetical protein